MPKQQIDQNIVNEIVALYKKMEDAQTAAVEEATKAAPMAKPSRKKHQAQRRVRCKLHSPPLARA